MGCGSSGTGGCSSGGCSKGCSSGGCNKLNSFDWLNNMLPPYLSETDNIYEVRFKNTRKEFFRNVNGLRLGIGDWVVVEGDRGGFDVGQVSLGGVLARLQLSKRSMNNPSVSKLYRKATDSDIETLKNIRNKESQTTRKTRNIIKTLRLDMKLSDVEYQGDGTKATFYYIADSRVDFRELIKLLAKEFKIRVEMKQIGLRHEAALLGGIGVCGRTLCCATWLTEFKVVTTSSARYQNLSLNPAKISGLCGRLKCCLNYELDAYKDALRDFPDVERLDTERGMVYVQKTDIFKFKIWFAYEGETTWYPLDVEQVKKYHQMNKKGQKAPALSNEVTDENGNDIKELGFLNVVAQHDPEAEKRENRREQERQRQKLRNNKASGNRNESTQKSNEQNPDGQLGTNKRKRKKKPENQHPPQNREQQPPRNKEQQNPQNREQQPPRNKEQQNPQNREQKPPRNKEQQNPQNREQQPPRNKEQQNPQNREQKPPRNKEQQNPQNREQNEHNFNNRNRPPRNTPRFDKPEMPPQT